VPFLLHDLEPADRAAMAANFPPIVTEQLVPIFWKEKRSPMQPFLLPGRPADGAGQREQIRKSGRGARHRLLLKPRAEWSSRVGTPGGSRDP